ncbi:MAG: Fe-S-containing protein, partial [Deltaproteobacteria bacterium]|nr:Fe-S-containing protein [Deltaproteobacteria bacterium]
MLLYLINVVDNLWVLAVSAPMILYILQSDKSRQTLKRLVLVAMGLGLLAAAILATLRLNTGWVIREFYDLGVLVPLLAALLIFDLLFTLAPRRLEARGQAGPGAGVGAGLEGSFSPTRLRIDQIKPLNLDRALGPFSAPAIRAVLALVLAVSFAVLFYRLAKVRPKVSFSICLVVLLGVFFLWPARLRNIRLPLLMAGLSTMALLTARVAPNVILYPFAFGVGLDSVFNLDYLAKVAGYLFGLTIIALVWLSIKFLLRQAPTKVVKWFIFLGLTIILAQLFLETFQILAGRRMLPRAAFALVLYFLERKSLFLFAQVAVWTVLALYLIVSSRITSPVGANPALKRKMRASLRDDLRAGILLLTAMTLAVLASTTLRQINSRGPVISEPDPVSLIDGAIRLDLAIVSDGNLHRHVYQSEDGTPVRFIVIKKSQSAYGVGLDACDICGQSGYYQRGDQVICKLCDVVMNKSTIGFPGGCNPVPL